MLGHDDQARRSRRLRDHGLGRRRGRGEGRVSRWCCAAARRRRPTRWSPALEKSLAKQVDKGKLDDAERDAVLGRVRAVTDLGELAECDLVLESIVEDLADEEAAVQRARPHLRRRRDPRHQHVDALRSSRWRWRRGRPEQVCGIHFFNPAPVMPLVEVVRAITTSDETIAAARDVRRGVRQERRSTCSDQAGFIVNALLFPYLNNAVKLLDAGVATRDDIDAAMKGGCNFPMGPLELLDLVGLDTSLSILEALYAEFRDPNYAPAPLLRGMVSAERLGRKTGAGLLRLLEEVANRGTTWTCGASVRGPGTRPR